MNRRPPPGAAPQAPAQEKIEFTEAENDLPDEVKSFADKKLKQLASEYDKKIAALVKKLTSQPKPKTEFGKTYDKTAPARVVDDHELDREKFFKEMKRREF